MAKAKANDQKALTTEVLNHGVVTELAGRLKVDPQKLIRTFSMTCWRADEQITNEQMVALCVVANEYKLNPFTKEIYAYPDKKGGIVPVVSVDGWARIVNEHPQYNGMRFETPPRDEWDYQDEDAKLCPDEMTCLMYRKDRDHPIEITEYLDEVYRPAFVKNAGKEGEYKIPGPWQSHTKRLLRHKTVIQTARIAFGFAGIYDQDEAERIIDAGDVEVVSSASGRHKKPETRPPEPLSPEAEDAEIVGEDVLDEQSEVEPGEIVTMCGPKEINELADLAHEAGAGDLDEFAQQFFDVPDINSLPLNRFADAENTLKNMIAEQKK